MTYKVNNALIISNLMKRYNLSNTAYSPLIFGDQITPVTMVDEIIKKLKNGVNSVTATGSTYHQYDMFTIPDSEVWTLLGFEVALSSGTTTQFRIFNIKNPEQADIFPLYTIAGATNMQYILPQKIRCLPGTIIGVTSGAVDNAGDTIRMRVLYEKEDFRLDMSNILSSCLDLLCFLDLHEM